MNRFKGALGALAAIALLAVAATPANASMLVNIQNAGANVSVTASGSLDLTGASLDHTQLYDTGIISGGSNWYVALGDTPGMDWYVLTTVDLPFGTDPTFYTSAATSGDAFSIWGESGIMSLVGVSNGYVSGSAISSSMTMFGQSIAGMGLTTGTYKFGVPDDTITLVIGGAVPEPSTWAMMILGLGGLGAMMRRQRALAQA